MLHGKRILVTGVVDARSIAYAVAERVQLLGGDVLCTAFPRDLDQSRQTVASLPRPADVLAADLTSDDDLATVRDHIAQIWGGLDGALHAIAFAPRDALAGDFLTARASGVLQSLHTSAVSYASLAGLLAGLAPEGGASLVGLDFDAGGAWPVYNWMGVSKAALESVNRYVARDLGARCIRSNLVAAGPLHTRAANGIPDFDKLLDAWERTAPLQWDATDPGPTADVVCVLLSDLTRAMTGGIIHVDGGYHAMAAPLMSAPKGALGGRALPLSLDH